MTNQEHKIPLHDPTATLEAAIEKIEIFTQQEMSSLKVCEDGQLIAIEIHPLEKIVHLVEGFFSSMFLDRSHREKEKKLSDIKKEILDACDTIKSHLPLIEKWEKGDSSQQKLAQRALKTISRYNAAVAHAQENLSSWPSRYAVYIRNRLLLDEEIRGKQIELPPPSSINYDSQPNSQLASKAFKKLHEVLSESRKGSLSFSSTHKNREQAMIDAFRVKRDRWFHEIAKNGSKEESDEVVHLIRNNFLELTKLIKQTPIKIEEDKEYIFVIQVLKIMPGSVMTIMGSFKRFSSAAELMSIPILAQNLRLILESTQTGYPYPSQSSGLALSDQLVDAKPLRKDQVPLFAQLEKRKKKLAQELFFFHPMKLVKTKQLTHRNEKCFNDQAPFFIQLHKKLTQEIMKGCGCMGELNPLIDDFYSFIEKAASPFHALSECNQKLMECFINGPAHRLKEEWLGMQYPALRAGHSQEKLQIASQILRKERENNQVLLTDSPNLSVVDLYLSEVGTVLGETCESIILQYQSEKIGFAPPMLTDFQRKLQVLAFQHLITFLNEMDDANEMDEDQGKTALCKKIEDNIDLLRADSLDHRHHLAIDITNELEVYFNIRFYMNSRHSGSM